MKRTMTWAVVLSMSGWVWAAGTSHWTQTNEADFKKGKMRHVVATNLGDLKLSRASKTVLEQDPRVSAVYAMVEGRDGTIYAGTGPQGIVLQVKEDKVSTLATLEEENVFSLLVEKDGKLLVGTGGEHGRILRLDPGKAKEKPVEVFKDEKTQYVWKMVQTEDGSLYAATGPVGKIFEIKGDGSKSVVLDSKEHNIMSLVSDGKDTLYAGSDPNGLVYRINRKTKEMFVLFDAGETEISALVLDGKGNLYAGTGQAGEGDEASVEESGETEKAGRPEGGEGVTPLPSQKPREPKPAPAPKPDPEDLPKGSAMGIEGRLGGLRASDGSFLMVSGRVLGLDDPDDGDGSQEKPGKQPGPIPAPVKAPAGAGMAGGSRKQPGPIVPGQTHAVEGNAVYKIDPSGFVTEVFRQPVVVMSLLERAGVLLVGTGNEGVVYQVNVAGEETAAVVKVDPKQVLCLLGTKDGRVMMGLSNVGGIAALSSGSATEGTYTSAVLDAQQISRFGKMRLRGSLPAGTRLTVATRSGNMREPDEAGWSKWSLEMPGSEYLQIGSPSARFLQYRLTLVSNGSSASPVVDEVDVAYQMPNLSPQVKAVKIGAGAEMEGGRAGLVIPMNPAIMQQPGQGKAAVQGRMRQVTWEAVDGDNDAMEYSLQVRSGARGRWILLQDKLKEPMYSWDTRGMADGRYQLKVVASDVKANPKGEGKEASRVSDVVVVDNTPPVIGEVKVTQGVGGVKLEVAIADRTGTVAGVEYSVDSKDEWQAVSASDRMFDSPEEAVSFTVDALPAGAHQITLRASDDHGNQAYEAVPVVIEGPTEKK